MFGDPLKLAGRPLLVHKLPRLKMANYFAHTAPSPDDWEPLKEHLLKVAMRTCLYASAFGAGEEGYIAGLLHDFGKYGERFQKRLHGIGRHIDHWTPGAWMAFKQYGKTSGRCLSLVTQGHHIGLQQDYKANYQAVCNSTPSPGTTLSVDSIMGLLQHFTSDKLSFPALSTSFQNRTGKYCSDMLDVRMFFSALVDADFLETEKYINSVEGKPQRSVAPDLNASRAFAALTRHIGMFGKNKNTRADIVAMRTTLFNACLAASTAPQSAFTLSAPTGSGKTLAMLAFALQHAIVHPSVSRIIVVLPFLSIIEQTAKIYREVFKDFPPGYIVEHHSLAGTRFHSDLAEDGNEDAAVHRERLAVENWDAPIIITTSVQFLESLFANRPSACRKLHNIVGSVVLFDEVQTLPPELAIHTLSALSRLVERYRTSVVFATATQPAFASLHSETLKWCASGWYPSSMLTSETEMQLFRSSCRVRYDWGARNSRLPWEVVSEKMLSGMPKQALCVVNTKKQALELTACLCDGRFSEEQGAVFHFSTNMCPRHRQDRLVEVKARLEARRPCFLVATQCIEAGVDISFPVVFRAWAPLEAIIQTAGRCNRNDELFPEQGVCHVFTPIEEEFPAGFYGSVTAIARAYIDTLDHAARTYLDDPTVIGAYYTKVYEVLRQPTSPKKFKDLCDALKSSDFSMVAQKYRLINQDTINVVVPYGDGNKLKAEVCENGLTADWCRRAQLYSVAVRRPRIGDPVLDIVEPAPIFKKGERLASEDWFLCTTNANYNELAGLEMPHGCDFLGA